ncbi:MAG: hypothetical protein OEV36_04235 [Myxococcales bacterium]|nr:hypothetical protein [Myxococcales bacterium]
MRVLVILALSGVLGMWGCGSSDGGSGGSAGMGGSGGSGGMGGSGGSAGSGGGGGASAEAAAFCNSYEGLCTYGGVNYDDRADCLASFDGYGATRQECVNTHIGLAANAEPGPDRELHCGHAAGLAPCN